MWFCPLILNSSRYFSRLQQVRHTQALKHRTSYFKSTLIFLGTVLQAYSPDKSLLINKLQNLTTYTRLSRVKSLHKPMKYRLINFIRIRRDSIGKLIELGRLMTGLAAVLQTALTTTKWTNNGNGMSFA